MLLARHNTHFGRTTRSVTVCYYGTTTSALPVLLRLLCCGRFKCAASSAFVALSTPQSSNTRRVSCVAAASLRAALDTQQFSSSTCRKTRSLAQPHTAVATPHAR